MGFSRILESIRTTVRKPTLLELVWLKRAGWLGANLQDTVPRAWRKRRIERAAARTERLGRQPLAPEYGEAGGERRPGEVRSSPACGDLYAWLVRRLRPESVVEFGSGFGVSGMYFASALEAEHRGRLYSFEINRAWADIAETNIRRVSRRFTLVRGAFEANVDAVVPGSIDIAFVDGIHTYEFVMRQFELLHARMRAGGLILLDDIDFRRPGVRMREAWEDIAADSRVEAAVEVNRHVGLVQV